MEDSNSKVEGEGKQEATTTASTPKMMRAIVIGGSGAIGKCLVSQLIAHDSFTHIVSIGRRALPLTEEELKNPKLVQKIGSMDKLAEFKPDFENQDIAFCCLGTTRKDAGSDAAFIKVDRDLVLEFAKLAKDAGTKQFHIVTSQISNPNSVFLYIRTKGEAEEGVKKLQFDKTNIYRPGLLDRGKNARFVEKLGLAIGMGIPVATVAKAMLNASLAQEASATKPVVNILPNGQINHWAKQSSL